MAITIARYRTGMNSRMKLKNTVRYMPQARPMTKRAAANICQETENPHTRLLAVSRARARMKVGLRPMRSATCPAMKPLAKRPPIWMVVMVDEIHSSSQIRLHWMKWTQKSLLLSLYEHVYVWNKLLSSKCLLNQFPQYQVNWGTVLCKLSTDEKNCYMYLSV